jgi:hypothetical protein
MTNAKPTKRPVYLLVSVEEERIGSPSVLVTARPVLLDAGERSGYKHFYSSDAFAAENVYGDATVKHDLLDDLTVKARVTKYTDGELSPFFRYGYDSYGLMGLDDLEAQVATLRRLKARLAKMREGEGEARTVGQYVSQVGRALGAAGVVVAGDRRAWDLGLRTRTLGEAAEFLSWQVERWGRGEALAAA